MTRITTPRIAPAWLAWILRLQGFHGVCLPPFGVFVDQARAGDARLARHELAHWQQAVRIGIATWYLTILWQYLRHGYRDAPLEIEARQAELEAP